MAKELGIKLTQDDFKQESKELSGDKRESAKTDAIFKRRQFFISRSLCRTESLKEADANPFKQKAASSKAAKIYRCNCTAQNSPVMKSW